MTGQLKVIGTLGIFLLALTVGSAQPAYPEVEAQSIALWEERDWNGLLQLTRKALQQGLDYKHLHLRKGIAHFQKKQYVRSALEMQKALHFDQSDTLAQEYLFFAWLGAGRTAPAWYHAGLSSPRTKQKLQIQPAQSFQSIYLEGGYRWTSLPDRIRPLGYGGLSITHRLGWRWHLTHHLNYLELQANTLLFRQGDVYLNLEGQLNPATTIIPYLHYAFSAGDFNLPLSEQPAGVPFDWKVRQQVGLAGITARVQTGIWQFLPEINFMALPTQETSLTPLPRPGNGPVLFLSETVDSLFWQLQGGLQIKYQLPWRLNLGGGLYALYNEKQTFRWVPMAILAYTPSDRWGVFAEYHYQPGQYYTAQQGFLLDNAPTPLHQKFIGVAYVSLSRRLQWYLTYQWEERELDQRYQTHAFFTGLKFNL